MEVWRFCVNFIEGLLNEHILATNLYTDQCQGREVPIVKNITEFSNILSLVIFTQWKKKKQKNNPLISLVFIIYILM
jgi:hypothetical protein